MNRPLLKIENLKVSFYTDHGVVRAVDQVSWELEENGSLGVIGESGCGKSVSALSVLRLIPDPPGKIEAGKILYNGRDILQMSEKEVCRLRGTEISMVFQDPVSSLNPSFTIGNQILETLRLRQGLSGSEAREKARSLLNAVGIPAPEQRMKEYPHQLSGGMNQLVMIAMALACGPRVLIADEPTTALDVTIQAQILNLFRSIKERLKMSIILITHDLGLVSQLVDRVIVMYAGKIVEQGLLNEIFQNPHHPYTKGLFSAIPRLKKKNVGKKEKLPEIPGVVPNLIDPTYECIFFPRCKYRMDKCKTTEPPLKVLGDRHTSKCWLE
ncbi:MAG: ABC transporter ATP-binding protein [Calditrichia bacterium]